MALNPLAELAKNPPVTIPEIDWKHLNAEKLLEMVADFAFHAIAAILIVIIGRIVSQFITRLIKRLMRHRHVEETVVIFVGNIINILFLLIVLIAALGQLGVQTASLLALLGAGSLAIGLALQGSLSSMAAGVMIIISRPYRLTDVVEVAGVSGKVWEINLSSTTLITPENKTVIIPNNKIASEKIINYTMQGKRRVDAFFPISYEDDIVLAKRILQQIVEEDTRFLKEPAVTIEVTELTGKAVMLTCQPFVQNADYASSKPYLLERGMIELKRAGFSMPVESSTLKLEEDKTQEKVKRLMHIPAEKKDAAKKPVQKAAKVAPKKTTKKAPGSRTPDNRKKVKTKKRR